ncbi:shikimate dehydrogenase family protein [Marivita hallyeonensis]|uniref:Shikimate dehydrogenase n=1 Tax=Marivita hallyeonensis TaxID=996342 RepID=A0A1M5XE32_9RHOB|nr:hypothetical protein [Marivita hallyeonensis]SHH97463.1 shikimate dehydrogenase [Marivita hallyeonensis]
MRISGKTKLFPIIGAPVMGVVSPPAVNAWFDDNGIDARMVPLEVPEKVLGAFWELLRASDTFLGCSVTYPHKQAAFDIVDTRTERAQRLGALNTVRRVASGALDGDASDGRALVRAIRASGVDLVGETAHVIGAGGGAGRAIVDALCESGLTSVLLEDNDAQRLEQTQDLIRGFWPATNIQTASDTASFLIDATPNGKDASAPPLFSPEAIDASTVVCDVAGAIETSQLLQAANDLGKTCIDAVAMGEGQVSAQMAFLFRSGG